MRRLLGIVATFLILFLITSFIFFNWAPEQHFFKPEIQLSHAEIKSGLINKGAIFDKRTNKISVSPSSLKAFAVESKLAMDLVLTADGATVEVTDCKITSEALKIMKFYEERVSLITIKNCEVIPEPSSPVFEDILIDETTRDFVFGRSKGKRLP